MNEATHTLPRADEIAERIRACRDELAALKRLQRMVKAAQAAQGAHERRHPSQTAKSASAGNELELVDPCEMKQA